MDQKLHLKQQKSLFLPLPWLSITSSFILMHWRLQCVRQYTLLSYQIYWWTFIAMSHLSGSRPMVFRTPSSLYHNWGSSGESQLWAWVLAMQVRSTHCGHPPREQWHSQLPYMHALKVGSSLPMVRNGAISFAGAGSLAVVGSKR